VARIADSIAANGDTARAVALLDSAVRRDTHDAAAWHQLGLLQWNQARSARDPNFMKDQKKIRLLIAADTALRLATQLAPDSARYWLSLSRFNIQSGVSTMRFASTGQARDGMSAAERSGEPLLLAEAADMAGMAAWRSYDAVANRGLPSGMSKVQLGSNNNWNRNNARDYVNSIASKIEPPTGDNDHAAALSLFSRAVGADSSNLRYSRHLYMAYAERKQWQNLATVAALRQRVLAFARERDWEQFHSPKNLSMALAAESGELMEHFLWATPEQSKAIAADPVKRQKIADELADVVVYALEFANATGLDLTASIEAKMIANGKKYPVEKAKGRSAKYDEL
jgi:NTP pyrophosphatase (non-canonical NTP hydrolase)